MKKYEPEPTPDFVSSSKYSVLADEAGCGNSDDQVVGGGGGGGGEE